MHPFFARTADIYCDILHTYRDIHMQLGVFHCKLTPLSLSYWIVAELWKQSMVGEYRWSANNGSLCQGGTVPPYLAACPLIGCQDKLLCWVTVLVAKQSALVFNIVESACIGLSVSQSSFSSLTHTRNCLGASAPYPISANKRRVCWWCVLKATWGNEGATTDWPWLRKELLHLIFSFSSFSDRRHRLTFHSHLRSAYSHKHTFTRTHNHK